MPISKHFLKSFAQFITNYKQSGASSSYISWGKEQNHSAVCDYFNELLSLITSNQEVIHDASVIEYLAVPINLSTSTNRYLHDCWNKFLIEYNSVAKIYSPINAMDSSTPMHLQIAAEGNSSERMMRDLKSALDSTQKAQEFSRKAYLSEVELLKKQIDELTRENSQILTENRALKEQVHHDQMFQTLNPQIATAQLQLASFAELLSTLHEITGGRASLTNPNSASVLPRLTKEEPTSEEKLKTKNAISSLKVTQTPPDPLAKSIPSAPEKDTPSKPMVHSEQEDVLTIKSSPLKKTSANVLAPPLLPPKPEPKPLLGGEGFFKELSLELAKRKANKAVPSSPIVVETTHYEQKKNM